MFTAFSAFTCLYVLYGIVTKMLIQKKHSVGDVVLFHMIMYSIHSAIPRNDIIFQVTYFISLALYNYAKSWWAQIQLILKLMTLNASNFWSCSLVLIIFQTMTAHKEKKRLEIDQVKIMIYAISYCFTLL
jgi:hypothetical protein